MRLGLCSDQISLAWSLSVFDPNLIITVSDLNSNKFHIYFIYYKSKPIQNCDKLSDDVYPIDVVYISELHL